MYTVSANVARPHFFNCIHYRSVVKHISLLLLLYFCPVYVLSELIHLLVVMGWAGNIWGSSWRGGLSTLLEVEPLLAPTPSRVDSE